MNEITLKRLRREAREKEVKRKAEVFRKNKLKKRE